jgi:hypothetical protein
MWTIDDVIFVILIIGLNVLRFLRKETDDDKSFVIALIDSLELGDRLCRADFRRTTFESWTWNEKAIVRRRTIIQI